GVTVRTGARPAAVPHLPGPVAGRVRPAETAPGGRRLERRRDPRGPHQLRLSGPRGRDALAALARPAAGRAGRRPPAPGRGPAAAAHGGGRRNDAGGVERRAVRARAGGVRPAAAARVARAPLP